MTTTTTIDAVEKVREAFSFSIDKFPLSGPDGMKTPFYGLFRSDNSAVVGNAVTKRYVPHQTDDVLAITEAVVSAIEDENMSLTTHFRDGHFVWYAPSKIERRRIFGTEDSIFPRFLLRAGYDGRAFKVSLGYYRDLCSNLHIPQAVGNSFSRNIIHTSHLRTKMSELINDVRFLADRWEDFGNAIAAMDSREVVLTQFLDEVYGKPNEDSKKAVTIHKNRTEAIVRRLMSEQQRSGRTMMGSDFKVTAWEAFNAVQGYVQHQATRKSALNNTMDRIILASTDSSVMKAERLALAV
jgi:hypothetical protein